MDGDLSGASDYLDPAIDIEVASLALPAPEWMGLGELPDDAAVVCTAERVASGDCNDGIDHARLAAILSAMMPARGRLYAWLQTDANYRKLLLLRAAKSAIRGFAPFDVRTVTAGDRKAHWLRRVTEVHAEPSERELIDVKAGILCLTLPREGLQRVGLPNSVLTFAGWQDDRFGLLPTNSDAEAMLTRFPSYRDLLSAFEIAVFPGGEHGSDCIFVSRSLSRNYLLDRVRRAVEEAGWTCAHQGHIEGEGYERMYKRSMSEERHPGHSRIDLDLQ